MKKWPYIGRRFFLNQKFYTHKKDQKTCNFNVLTINLYQKITFLKILPKELFLLIKKVMFQKFYPSKKIYRSKKLCFKMS